MLTYVAVVGDTPMIAFRAEGDRDAESKANAPNGIVRYNLITHNDPHGGMLWDGKQQILVRQANPMEHDRWVSLSNAVNRAPGEDPNAFVCWLIPVSSPRGVINY